jgi:hypothetical protein
MTASATARPIAAATAPSCVTLNSPRGDATSQSVVGHVIATTSSPGPSPPYHAARAAAPISGE